MPKYFIPTRTSPPQVRDPTPARATTLTLISLALGRLTIISSALRSIARPTETPTFQTAKRTGVVIPSSTIEAGRKQSGSKTALTTPPPSRTSQITLALTQRPIRRSRIFKSSRSRFLRNLPILRRSALERALLLNLARGLSPGPRKSKHLNSTSANLVRIFGRATKCSTLLTSPLTKKFSQARRKRPRSRALLTLPSSPNLCLTNLTAAIMRTVLRARPTLFLGMSSQNTGSRLILSSRKALSILGKAKNLIYTPKF